MFVKERHDLAHIEVNLFCCSNNRKSNLFLIPVSVKHVVIFFFLLC